jgi:sugar phosphate permease
MTAWNITPDPAATKAPATRVRYGVLAFLCALTFILYIDRICISQAADAIERDLAISHSRMGYVFSAFTLAYGLFEVPTGRWGDRFGSRGVLTRIVLWWSAFTALTGAVTGLPMLLIVRFLFGAGEAGALPNAARVVTRWFPSGRRGTAQGLVNTSTLVGGAVAPAAMAYLIGGIGWRWAFVIFGGLGVVWAAAFHRWFRDNPAEHPAVNESERRLIAGDAPGDPAGTPHPPVPWAYVLTSPNVWLLGGVITCSAFTSYLYFTWYPKYLQDARGEPAERAGLLASLVLAGGAAGFLLGGYLSDWLTRLTGERRRSLQGLGCGGLGSASLSLYVAVHCDSAVTASLFTMLAYFCACVNVAAWWAAVMAISGKHLGALAGLLNSMGVPGAFVSPLFVGAFVDWQGERGLTGREQWDPTFYAFVAALFLGACGWLFIDASRSIVQPPEKPRPAGGGPPQ